MCQDRLGEAIAKRDRKQAGLPAADLAGSTARSIQIWMKTHQGVIKCQKAELEERGCNQAQLQIESDKFFHSKMWGKGEGNFFF